MYLDIWMYLDICVFYWIMTQIYGLKGAEDPPGGGWVVMDPCKDRHEGQTCVLNSLNLVKPGQTCVCLAWKLSKVVNLHKDDGQTHTHRKTEDMVSLFIFSNLCV